jgi:hypothetical protein
MHKGNANLMVPSIFVEIWILVEKIATAERRVDIPIFYIGTPWMTTNILPLVATTIVSPIGKLGLTFLSL